MDKQVKAIANIIDEMVIPQAPQQGGGGLLEESNTYSFRKINEKYEDTNLLRKLKSGDNLFVVQPEGYHDNPAYSKNEFREEFTKIFYKYWDFLDSVQRDITKNALRFRAWDISENSDFDSGIESHFLIGNPTSKTIMFYRDYECANIYQFYDKEQNLISMTSDEVIDYYADTVYTLAKRLFRQSVNFDVADKIRKFKSFEIGDDNDEVMIGFKPVKNSEYGGGLIATINIRSDIVPVIIAKNRVYL